MAEQGPILDFMSDFNTIKKPIYHNQQEALSNENIQMARLTMEHGRFTIALTNLREKYKVHEAVNRMVSYYLDEDNKLYQSTLEVVKSRYEKWDF